MADKNTPGADLAAMRRIETKLCAHCGAAFAGIRIARYCTDRCKQAARYQRNRKAKP